MRVLRFDDFTLDLSRRVLLRAGNEVALRPQVFDVLVYLAEHHGRTISKKELFDTVWGGAARTDDSVVQCIVDIREALGDAEHRLVKTVPRRGYLFTAEVIAGQLGDETAAAPTAAQTPNARFGARPSLPEPEAEAPEQWKRVLIVAGLLITVLAASGWLLRERLRPQPPAVLTMLAAPSIAVLPFKALGGELNKGDAAGALTDAVTTELTRSPRGYGLRVRSASGHKVRVDNPRGVGRELGVRYLVLGSTSLEGGVRQINIQLIESESGRQVWAEPFTYAPGEVDAQTRVAVGIVRMVVSQVLRAEARLPLPAQPEAGHYVILGRSLIPGERGVESNRQAMALFDKARVLDPDSVPALLGYGRTRVNEVLNRWAPQERWGPLLDEAEGAINHAARLDTWDPGLHVLRGAYLRARGMDAEAVKAFERALDLYRYHTLAHAELGRAKIEVGLASETVGHIEDAIRLSPNDAYVGAWYYWAGMAEAHVGRYERAIHWLLKTRSANRAYPNTVPWLAIAYGGLEEWDKARGYMKEHLDNFPRFSMAGWRLALPMRHAAVVEQRARIEAILCQLGAPGCDVTTSSTR